MQDKHESILSTDVKTMSQELRCLVKLETQALRSIRIEHIISVRDTRRKDQVAIWY
jgi:hypothetical protein